MRQTSFQGIIGKTWSVMENYIYIIKKTEEPKTGKATKLNLGQVVPPLEYM